MIAAGFAVLVSANKQRLVVQFASSGLAEGVIPKPAQFSRVRDLAGIFWVRTRSVLRDPSLRLKTGSGQDDAFGMTTF
jgi:hypothetical protein